MKILPVEDAEETADYVADRLTREGHVLDRAATGEDHPGRRHQDTGGSS